MSILPELLPEREYHRIKAYLVANFPMSTEWFQEAARHACGLEGLTNPKVLVSHGEFDCHLRTAELLHTDVTDPLVFIQSLVGKTKTQGQKFKRQRRGLWAVGEYSKVLRDFDLLPTTQDHTVVPGNLFFGLVDWEGKNEFEAPEAYKIRVRIAECILIGYWCKSVIGGYNLFIKEAVPVIYGWEEVR